MILDMILLIIYDMIFLYFYYAFIITFTTPIYFIYCSKLIKEATVDVIDVNTIR